MNTDLLKQNEQLMLDNAALQSDLKITKARLDDALDQIVEGCLDGKAAAIFRMMKGETVAGVKFTGRVFVYADDHHRVNINDLSLADKK